MINGLLYLINLLESPNNTQGKREMVSFFIILRQKQTWTKETPPLCFCDQMPQLKLLYLWNNQNNFAGYLDNFASYEQTGKTFNKIMGHTRPPGHT